MPAPLRVSIAACAAAVVVLAVSAGGLSRPDGLIERSFAGAFVSQGEADGRVSAPRMGALQPARLDPAHLHLSRLPVATLGPALALGDRITVAARNGSDLAYEVIEVRPMAGDATGQLDAEPPRLLLVTAVSTGVAPAQTIRLVIEAGDRPAATEQPVGIKPHAL